MSIHIIPLDIVTWISTNKIIQLLGGFSIASAAIAALFFERLKVFWKSTTDKQLESIKGEIQRNNSIINSLSTAYLSNFNKVQEKRIEAADKIWSCVLVLKEYIPSVVKLSYAILTDEEISNKTIENTRAIKSATLSLNEDEFTQKISPIQQEVERYKPFISDKTDLLFSAYLAFSGRITYQFIKTFKTSTLSSWKHDKAIEGLLKPILTEKEITAIYRTKINSFGTALYLLETKLIAEIRESLYGKNLALDTLEHLKYMDTIWRNPEPQNP